MTVVDGRRARCRCPPRRSRPCRSPGSCRRHRSAWGTRSLRLDRSSSPVPTRGSGCSYGAQSCLRCSSWHRSGRSGALHRHEPRQRTACSRARHRARTLPCSGPPASCSPRRTPPDPRAPRSRPRAAQPARRRRPSCRRLLGGTSFASCLPRAATASASSRPDATRSGRPPASALPPAGRNDASLACSRRVAASFSNRAAVASLLARSIRSTPRWAMSALRNRLPAILSAEPIARSSVTRGWSPPPVSPHAAVDQDGGHPGDLVGKGDQAADLRRHGDPHFSVWARSCAACWSSAAASRSRRSLSAAAPVRWTLRRPPGRRLRAPGTP